ncbi:MAG TPA: O-antigen ligase family protein [Anaerolineales bacterium]|nr:O-antigen ligase family protein [Anaerolineales bacterium]
MLERLKRLGNLSVIIAWAAIFILMPITSLPLLSRFAGGSSVAPAAFLPLIWVVFVWFIPWLLKKGAMPRESIPFIFFISVAIIAGSAAFFFYIPPFKDVSVPHEELRSLLTLAIGAAFYLVTASWFSRDQARLASVLKWINISGIIIILWTAIQAFFIFRFHSNYPGLLLKFQRLIATRDLFIGRVTGFAFEPSWLAHQMNLLYLPFWLGATVSGTSACRFRIWKISLENILFFLGVVVVFLASRVGTLAILLVLALLGLYANILLGQWAHKKILARFVQFSASIKKGIRILLPFVLLVIFVSVYVVGAIGLVYGLSHVDTRLARFFTPQSEDQYKIIFQNPYNLFNYLEFAERYVYWVGGWNIFNLHPILGVGLGNAGFFFQKQLPSYGWSLPEVMDAYYRTTELPNIKSLWVRLLAETGIVGFSSFIAWFYVLFRLSWFIRLSKNPVFKMIGWSGLFVLVAYLIEGFSTDTFALPYLWVSLGIVSAAGALMRVSSEKV